MSLDIYETWSQLVKKHTVGGACNFQDAACELALLVADHEWDRAIAIAKDMENELQDRFEEAYMKGVVAGANAEREHCAQVCDSMDPLQDGAIAAAIRARGNT
jgi:hypothetical protein